MDKLLRKPPWLRVKGILDQTVRDMQKTLDDKGLLTVCHEAACPNRYECWSHKSFTFILLGKRCTRMCPFCNIESVSPEPLDYDEPEKIAQFIHEQDLRHIVLTSVTRDDMPDGGAAHFINTIRAIRSYIPSLPIELLIPDFGDFVYLKNVVREKTAILGHNIETVERLYPAVRPKFTYSRCLEILAYAKQCDSDNAVKSSLLVGLGEETDEIYQTMRELRQAGCDIVFIGQYLMPSRGHYPVKKYYSPQEFDQFKQCGYSLGFRSVESGPLVRSSYGSWNTNKTLIDNE